MDYFRSTKPEKVRSIMVSHALDRSTGFNWEPDKALFKADDCPIRIINTHIGRAVDAFS